MRAAEENVPIGPDAFAEESDVARQAQAAILLGIGSQLRGDRIALQATAASAARPSDMFHIETLTDPRKARQRLVEGTRSEEELVREVAATSLARYDPTDPALLKLIAAPNRPDGTPAHTSTVIHGTFAANGTWWRPNGFFYIYAATLWNDLYSAADFYSWSGGYSDGARDQGADLLVDWMATKGINTLSLMTHSHGGSVAMLASGRGVSFNNDVLLSCPVHPAKYDLNFAAVQRVTSIRVKLDLVLLADGSGSRFNDSRYRENVLPIWFNHSATHDPVIWGRYNVPAML